jgi:hypothetical protein
MRGFSFRGVNTVNIYRGVLREETGSSDLPSDYTQKQTS